MERCLEKLQEKQRKVISLSVWIDQADKDQMMGDIYDILQSLEDRVGDIKQQAEAYIKILSAVRDKIVIDNSSPKDSVRGTSETHDDVSPQSLNPPQDLLPNIRISIQQMYPGLDPGAISTALQDAMSALQTAAQGANSAAVSRALPSMQSVNTSAGQTGAGGGVTASSAARGGLPVVTQAGHNTQAPPFQTACCRAWEHRADSDQKQHSAYCELPASSSSRGITEQPE